MTKTHTQKKTLTVRRRSYRIRRVAAIQPLSTEAKDYIIANCLDTPREIVANLREIYGQTYTAAQITRFRADTKRGKYTGRKSGQVKGKKAAKKRNKVSAPGKRVTRAATKMANTDAIMEEEEEKESAPKTKGIGKMPMISPRPPRRPTKVFKSESPSPVNLPPDPAELIANGEELKEPEQARARARMRIPPNSYVNEPEWAKKLGRITANLPSLAGEERDTDLEDLDDGILRCTKTSEMEVILFSMAPLYASDVARIKRTDPDLLTAEEVFVYCDAIGKEPVVHLVQLYLKKLLMFFETPQLFLALTEGRNYDEGIINQLASFSSLDDWHLIPFGLPPITFPLGFPLSKPTVRLTGLCLRNQLRDIWYAHLAMPRPAGITSLHYYAALNHMHVLGFPTGNATLEGQLPEGELERRVEANTTSHYNTLLNYFINKVEEGVTRIRGHASQSTFSSADSIIAAFDENAVFDEIQSEQAAEERAAMMRAQGLESVSEHSGGLILVFNNDDLAMFARHGMDERPEEGEEEEALFPEAQQEEEEDDEELRELMAIDEHLARGAVRIREPPGYRYPEEREGDDGKEEEEEEEEEERRQ